MSSRPILSFPDPRLRVAATPVTRFDADLRELAADLLDTMREAPGIGITAPHVGVSLRLVVLELVPGSVRTYVNPVLDGVSRETIRHVEGSVSMPGITDELERHAHVRVRYHDLDGVEHVEEANGLLAVCHQHEIDQLDGIFWIDRLSRLKRDRLVARYNKLRRG
ncbi:MULTISPECIES: peptide deformylase [Bosea]|uniref:peptide deformylase n=1 Tax=Bosea TaxID=85413 RepID=UPI00214F8992|nr:MULTISPECIES: peptide deformylase [Bosea]MCR4521244.1 peptide deformylase [Bosea sp. 47.2.35]MDR6826668.1 peptide deformylase [Bosea robiniae]MDR6893378.1 peptide deformylase [Bosea sp. BE109]MDR7136923.1 peptide deformylase [Bosea sp. BE168]MDR7173622.1 peptide deformylase [Bosea sp. BE271]